MGREKKLIKEFWEEGKAFNCGGRSVYVGHESCLRNTRHLDVGVTVKHGNN